MNLPSLSKLEEIYGVRLDEDQKEKIGLYLDLLNRWNKRINLTSLDTVEDQLRFHFFESFWTAERFLESTASISDVGSGAGFPGLAIKLYRPSLAVTLIEKNYKKVVFLKEVSRALALEVQVFEGTGEEFSGWKQIQIATFRALKPSCELVGILSDNSVQILLFGGEKLGPTVARCHALHREKLPSSANRFVSLLQC